MNLILCLDFPGLPPPTLHPSKGSAHLPPMCAEWLKAVGGAGLRGTQIRSRVVEGTERAFVASGWSATRRLAKMRGTKDTWQKSPSHKRSWSTIVPHPPESGKLCRE